MSNNHSNLRLGHLNVRGLENHIDGIKLLLNATNYHLFAVTETKLKASSPAGPIRVPAYNFIKHSLASSRGRGSRSCGGIGLYVRKGLKATPVLKSSFNPELPISQRLEFIAVQIKINDLNIGIVVLYNPVVSNPNFAREYEKLLFDLQDFAFDRIFVLGDFNINVRSSQPTTNYLALTRIHDAFNLSILPTPPTRIADRSSTTIDLMITDCPQSILSAKTCTNSISDHEIIYLISDIRIQRAVTQRINIKDFRNVDVVALQADFQSRDFHQVLGETNINVKAERLTAELRNLMQRHVPERSIQVKDKRTPWITFEIERAISVRDLAHALYKRNPNRSRSNDEWKDYTRKRNKVVSLILAAKRRYGEEQFGRDLPAKKLWNNLRREGIHNSNKNFCCDHIDGEELNTFFCDGHRQLRVAAPNDARNSNTEPPHRTAADRGERFTFRPTSVVEVARKISEIRTNAEGTDGIPISFIKMLSPFIFPLLVHVYNAAVDAKVFPDIWKKALVTPIPKLANPVQPKDFRPISVLPALSKVLEKILLDQIVEHVNDTQAGPALLAANQSGYRKGYSTTTALTKITHDIVNNLDDGRCTVMVLVDFSLAFNCVDHRKLEGKLYDEFHFSNMACNLISSFLGSRSQAVKLGDHLSSQLPVPEGTPQGSCLSALLFSLYINSLPLGLKCSYQLYADDLQIYVSGPIQQVDRIISIINEDLKHIERWAGENKLFPNPKKTQAIIFAKENSTVVPTTGIIFCGAEIAILDTVTNLGLRMDRCLKWTPQVNDITSKVFCTLRTFKRFAPVLSLHTKQKLVQSVILPFFTYCDVVYYPGLSAALKDQLDRCFKASVRFVHNIKRRESTAGVINTIIGHDLTTNYHERICCFMRQGFTGSLPSYLQQHLRRGRLERSRAFVVPRHSTSMRKSVLIAGTIVWNQLPLSVKQQPSITSFRAALRNRQP